MKKSLNNQVAIITGGTGGIGRFVTEKFLREGFGVILLEHRKKSLKSFSMCEGYSLDVANPAAVKKFIARIIKRHKKIDALINIAAVIGPMGEFHTNRLDEWKRVIEVNLIGTVNVCHAVLPFMVRRRQGKIINFSGGGAVQSFPNFSAYACSKAAVVRFTENLAREYEKYNIQINAVAPGLILTKMVEAQVAAGPKKVGREYHQRILNAKKTGGDSPEKAAELVWFLAKPKNKLTGKVISAPWDGWQKLDTKAAKKLSQSSLYTLRRIDNKNFYEKS